MTDKYFGGSVGALAVSESNPDIVFAGGGETPIRGNVSYGDGVWKIDRRRQDVDVRWGSRRRSTSRASASIPTNPDIVYVGALGHAFGAEPRPRRLQDRRRRQDVEEDPVPQRFHRRRRSHHGARQSRTCSTRRFWQADRTPWTFSSGGPGSGIFKTTDGGDHWTEITHNQGLPTGLLGSMGIAISPAKPTRVWALIENEPAGGVYRSDDAGATWKFLSGNRNLRQRAWYYSKIYADPKDTNVVAAPQVGAEWSKDGGKTCRADSAAATTTMCTGCPERSEAHRMVARQRRGDHDRRRHDAAERGRADRTVLSRPPHERTFPITSADRSRTRARRCGPVRAAAAAWRGGGGGGGGRGGPPPSPYSEFYGVAGGEIGYIASDPLDPDIIYGGNYSGVLQVLNRRTGLSERLDPWPLNPMGHDAADSKYRFQWTYPIMNSPFNPHVLYAGSNVVFKSADDGKTWSIISPDLTRHDPEDARQRRRSRSRRTRRRSSTTRTVFALQESPITPGLIWAGSDDGLIHVTRDGGKTWKNVTPKWPRSGCASRSSTRRRTRRERRGSPEIAISSTT